MYEQRNYWGVIPGEVLHDRELTAAAKLLYVILSSMAGQDGYCWPANETLAAELDLSRRRVQELLSRLQERGYIRVDVRRAEDTREVERRYIYCGLFLDREAPPPSCEKPQDPPAENCTPSCEISHDPPAKSRSHIIGRKEKEKYITPIPPEGAARKGTRKRADKSVPDWKPERFEAFWAYYREHARGENRQGAVRAWDKLKPDDATIDAMARTLRWQTASEEWRRGVGIPYAASWLNGRRWTDSPKASREPEPPPDCPPESWEERFGWQ